MLRRSPIYVALQPEAVSSGLQQDKHLLHKILWDSAANVTFYAGKVRRRTGPSLAFDAGDSPIRGLSQQQTSDGVRWIWAASGGEIRRWYGPAPELIDTQSWVENQSSTQDPTQWDFTHFGNWTIINKSVGQAKIYKPNPGPGLVAFGDSPSDVQVFKKKANFVMAFGYGDRKTRVGWSDADNIESWTASTTNAAGALSIDDFDTRIKAAAALGQAIAVFAEDQVGLVSYTGLPYYFGQRVVLDGIGAVNKKAVVSDTKNVVGVGRGGCWWTDGITSRYIDEGFLHDYLQDNVNWEQSGKIHVARNDYTGCFEFFFPMIGSNVVNEGWSFDPRTGGWSPIPACSAKDERRLFRRPIVGSNDAFVSYDQDDPLVDTPLTLETKPILVQVQGAEGFLDVHTDSVIDEVDLLLKTVSNVEFSYGVSQESVGPFEWTSWIACAADSRVYKLPKMPSGVYHKLRFRNTAQNWSFDLQGFMFFGSIEGSKRTQP